MPCLHMLSDRVRKKWKILQKFAEESDDYVEKVPDYVEISKNNKVVPLAFSHQRLNQEFNSFMTCLTFYCHSWTGTYSLNVVFLLVFSLKL